MSTVVMAEAQVGDRWVLMILEFLHVVVPPSLGSYTSVE